MITCNLTTIKQQAGQCNQPLSLCFVVSCDCTVSVNEVHSDITARLIDLKELDLHVNSSNKCSTMIFHLLLWMLHPSQCSTTPKHLPGQSAASNCTIIKQEAGEFSFFLPHIKNVIYIIININIHNSRIWIHWVVSSHLQSSEVHWLLTSSLVVRLHAARNVWKPARPSTDHIEKNATTATSRVHNYCQGNQSANVLM